MIRHIVLIRFAADTSADERNAIFKDLADLQGAVAGMSDFSAGANVSPEGLGKGFSHAFTATFVDAAARDAYLVHPAHQAAGARLVSAAQGGLEGILVVDLTLATKG